MRLAILILFFALGVIFSRADEKFTKVPTDAFIGYIIPQEYATEKLRDYFGRDVTGFWTPTFDQVKTAEAAVVKVLQGPKENRSSILRYYPNESKADRALGIKDFEEQSRPYIIKNYKNYTVQFIGLIIDGKKQVICHYALGTDSKMAANVYWLGPADSGASFWSIQFDVDSGICLDYEDMGSA